MAELIAKSREAALSAIRVFNDPMTKFKSEPSELSSGRQQRVALARALVADPTLLICDEPTGDLDRPPADEILSLMQILNREHGKTVVMVTHDARAAAEYVLNHLHVDKGQLLERTRGVAG